MGEALRDWFFPERKRPLHGERAFSIALRTLHLASFGVLFGGYALGVPAERFLLSFYLTLLSGIGLIFLEVCGLGLYWFLMGKGAMVLVKVAILLVIPFFGDGRVVLLALVIVIASVGSHMPGRFRHYSFLHKREVDPAESLRRRNMRLPATFSSTTG